MIILITFILGFLSIYVFYRSKKCQYIIPKGLNELPLEKGFPLLGILPLIKPPLHVYFAKLSKKHGPLYRIRMGMRDIVVLNNFDIIKKCMKGNGDAFSGGVKLQWVSITSQNSGLIFIDGIKWAIQRSFLLTIFRDFGVGKTKFLEIVQNECDMLLNELKEFDGKCVNFGNLIPLYTANIISKFIMNKRFSRDDPSLKFIQYLIIEIARRNDLFTTFNIMFPFLDNFRFLMSLVFRMTYRWRIFEKAHLYFKQEIDEHMKNLDLNSEGEDLIDRFLMKQQELKEKTGTYDTFTDFQLIRLSFELFIAGYESTSTALGWSFLFMSKFPDIQEKVYSEIIDEVGHERMVTMNDRKALNYSAAVMDEIMRLASVAPLITRRTFTDTNVNGYFIPQNSFIFQNIFACHTDPNTWENPMEFKPQRFLFVDGDGKLKYRPREELIPFSIGKRQCPGESLARMEYFIFFISILKKFKVRFSEDISENEYEETLLGNDGLIRFSKIKEFIFSSRHHE